LGFHACMIYTYLSSITLIAGYPPDSSGLPGWTDNRW
jgi:hypothetical protein